MSKLFLEFSGNGFHLRFLQNFVVRPNQNLVGESLDSRGSLVGREECLGCLECFISIPENTLVGLLHMIRKTQEQAGAKICQGPAQAQVHLRTN